MRDSFQELLDSLRKQRKLATVLLVAVAFSLCAFEVDVSEAGPLGAKTVREVVKGIKLDEISSVVRALYVDEGWLLAEVETYTDSSLDRYIVVVNAGARAFVENYRITGWDGELPRLILNRNKPFRRKELTADMNSLLRMCENSGYPFAIAEIESLNIGSPQGERIAVDIVLNVERGDSVLISFVLIPKSSKTKPHVIQKAMLIRTPELYSRKRINAGVKRLNKLGYIRVTTEPEPLLDESGKWVLSVNFTEGRTVLIDGVFGYAPRGGTGGLSGRIDAAFDNMWGTGRRFELKWNQAVDEYLRFSTSFTEPFLFGGFGSMTLLGNYNYRSNSYTERNFGVKYKLPLSFTFSVSFGGMYQAILPDSASAERIPKTQETHISVGAEVERLFPRINPTAGWDASIKISPASVQRSGPAVEALSLEENDLVVRIEASAAVAFSIGRNFVLHEKVVGRSVQSDSTLPISDLYFMGGWGSLRGYREDQFSAEHVAWSNTEFRALVGGDSHGFAFIDIGALGIPSEDAQIKTGYGIGFRLSTAVGRWTVAYGIEGGESITNGMIHVGLTAER